MIGEMLFIGSYYHVWMSLSFDVMQRFYQVYAMVVGGILATTETVEGSSHVNFEVFRCSDLVHCH